MKSYTLRVLGQGVWFDCEAQLDMSSLGTLPRQPWLLQEFGE